MTSKIRFTADNTVRHETDTNYGKSLRLITVGGAGFCHIYHYGDDTDNIYIEDLSVKEINRKIGIGTGLMAYFEGRGRKHGFKYALLRVLRDSWMYEWYQRLGYILYQEELGAGDDYVWMRKSL